MACPARLLAVAAALLGSPCGADIVAPHRHVQTPGVPTCSARGGACRVPGKDGDDTGCETDELAMEFDVKCDSGCGYWRGRCGQTCCIPVHGGNASAVLHAANGSSQERAEAAALQEAPQGANSSSQEKAEVVPLRGAAAAPEGGLPAAWVDAAGLAATALIVFGVYRLSRAKEQRSPGSLLEHDSDAVE